MAWLGRSQPNRPIIIRTVVEYGRRPTTPLVVTRPRDRRHTQPYAHKVIIPTVEYGRRPTTPLVVTGPRDRRFAQPYARKIVMPAGRNFATTSARPIICTRAPARAYRHSTTITFLRNSQLGGAAPVERDVNWTVGTLGPKWHAGPASPKWDADEPRAKWRAGPPEV